MWKERDKDVHLKKHKLWVHQKDDPVTCDQCGKEFKSQIKLTFHKRTCTALKQFSCSVCDYTAKTEATVNRHSQGVHSEKNTDLLACSLCEYRTSWTVVLKRHMNNHSSEKKYKCDSCPYATRQSDVLKQHKKIHGNPSKPFECELCPYRTTVKQSLLTHASAHQTEPPFKCDHVSCDYSAKTKNVLH